MKMRRKRQLFPEVCNGVHLIHRKHDLLVGAQASECHIIKHFSGMEASPMSRHYSSCSAV
ncbi:hypothetical protein KSX_46050 [Ktedonospora formicarum]|uniref:Uncharacterized protein n=1 Tax=Ktedonospora formicarum TaxID=2778364 RepID=A0A8J3HYA9_9CHLR|nr:hypothetical protein KSX_46050 [Ktedonospora formicarum]